MLQNDWSVESYMYVCLMIQKLLIWNSPTLSLCFNMYLDKFTVKN